MNRFSFLTALFSIAFIPNVSGITFHHTASPTYNTTTPGDNSGWQYTGLFHTSLGVPIAPHFFITAKHIGGTIGMTFNWHGDLYTTIAVHNNPDNDLAIWEIDHSKPFPNYAPLSGGFNDLGGTVTLLGRGTQRGEEVVLDGALKGWKWGGIDLVQRWGKNVTAGSAVTVPGLGALLQCDFNQPGIANECHLSVYDSGGGMFIFESGMWRLAGINYGVDGPFRRSAAESEYYACLFDAGGMQYYDGSTWVTLTDTVADIPTSFYCSRIFSSKTWITSIAPEAYTFPAETFSSWQKLYFTPTQIANTAVTGPEGDFDEDGINNLLEFALNLDPTFAERTMMPPSMGYRGLPLIRVESSTGSNRLTMRYVRRKSNSGSNLTYVPEFSDDLITWTSSTNTSLFSVNTRWERARDTDTFDTTSKPKRYARLRVVLNE